MGPLRRPPGRDALRGATVAAAVAAAAGQWVPATVSLGQWSPLRRLPGEWCRWRGPGDRPAVSLTFDDGPDPANTPLLLDVLDEHAFTATFFCVGEQVRRYPGLVAEIARRGHQVELHGDRHCHHLLRSPRWVAADIDRGIAALGACGIQPRWFRPPYGQCSGATLVVARRRGLRAVLWSAWGREWAEAAPAAVARRVGAGLAPGAVVLLHDSDAYAPEGTARRASHALATVAEELRRRSWGAVSLDELVGSGPGSDRSETW